MPLPFNPDNGKRKFSCYCCGITQNTLKDLWIHIRANHQEGKDFVTCPIGRCSAPVRDMRAHFKMFHRQEPMPKNCQMRASVWRDARDPNKKKKFGFKEGYYVSAKNRGKKMHYNSGWEREVYETLEKYTRVLRYEVEPIAVPYVYDGERHTYYPDLKVYLDDGRVEVWEIKPMSQTNLALNEAKWDYCQEYCSPRGWKFRVVTEVGIDKIKRGIWLE